VDGRTRGRKRERADTWKDGGLPDSWMGGSVSRQMVGCTDERKVLRMDEWAGGWLD
jgi:hypothetical protein